MTRAGWRCSAPSRGLPAGERVRAAAPGGRGPGRVGDVPRWPAGSCGADLIDQVLLAAIVVNVGGYVPSTLASADRAERPRVRRRAPLRRRPGRPRPRGSASWRPPARGGTAPAGRAGRRDGRVLGAGYLASLGYAAVQPPAPPANQQLASWLAAPPPDLRHRRLLAGEHRHAGQRGPRSPSGRCMPGTSSGICGSANDSWYFPHVHTATFLVTDSQPGFYNHFRSPPRRWPLRPARAHLPGRSVHRPGLGQEPACRPGLSPLRTVAGATGVVMGQRDVA